MAVAQTSLRTKLTQELADKMADIVVEGVSVCSAVVLHEHCTEYVCSWCTVPTPPLTCSWLR